MPEIDVLSELLASIEPVQVAGEYVVISVEFPDPDLPALAMISEAEGVTYVVRRLDADLRGLPYDYVAAWITLQVHSSLAAVGFSAAVCTAVARAGISCNVLAGAFHDHLLVPRDRAAETLEILRAFSNC